jgi:hypothetical protein
MIIRRPEYVPLLPQALSTISHISPIAAHSSNAKELRIANFNIIGVEPLFHYTTALLIRSISCAVEAAPVSSPHAISYSTFPQLYHFD